MGHAAARGTRHPIHGCLPRPRRSHPLGRLDNAQGDITFRDYVEKEWLPNKHVEASTRAAYISYLDKHFYPFFGHRRLNKISPTLVQDWVTHAKDQGLAPRSIRKYHVFLSSVFTDQRYLAKPYPKDNEPRTASARSAAR